MCRLVSGAEAREAQRADGSAELRVRVQSAVQKHLGLPLGSQHLERSVSELHRAASETLDTVHIDQASPPDGFPFHTNISHQHFTPNFTPMPTTTTTTMPTTHDHDTSR